MPSFCPPGSEELVQPVGERVLYANRLFELAIEAQRSGDWALYGERMNQLGQLLQELTVNTDEQQLVPTSEPSSQPETP